MLPAKYQQNRSNVSEEEIVRMYYIRYGHYGHLEFGIMSI